MTYDDLRKRFEYESETGLLRQVFGGRKPYPWRPIGHNGRYRAWTHAGKVYYLHRLVWLWHHGELPLMLDHINGDTLDNRIENLRPCTNAQNQYNAPRKSHNKSGYKGVAYCPMYRKPWRARIVVDKKVKGLGYYDTPEEAAAAYDAAALLYAKEFARTNAED